MRKFFTWLIAIVLVASFVVGGFFVYQGIQPPVDAPMPSTTFSAEDPDTIDESAESGGEIDEGPAADPSKEPSEDNEKDDGQQRSEQPEPTIDGPSVYIGSIGLEAPLISTDAKTNGYLELPMPPDATWYRQTKPLGSAQGKSLIAGHVDMGRGTAAPFNRLHRIQKGAVITTTDFDGTVRRYKASSLAIYPHSGLPSSIFDEAGPHQLVLVTCSGPYLEIGDADYYEYNLIVTADPIG